MVSKNNSKNKKLFSGWLNKSTFEVAATDKIKLLKEQYTDNEQDEVNKITTQLNNSLSKTNNKPSFVRMQTMIDFQKANPQNKNVEAPWHGMGRLDSEPDDPIRKADFKDTELCEKFKKERLGKVINVLNYKPYVFIGGRTGVGKTTFIEKVLGTHPKIDSEIFMGEKSILKWIGEEIDEDAENDDNQINTKYRVLFIDEG